MYMSLLGAFLIRTFGEIGEILLDLYAPTFSFISATDDGVAIAEQIGGVTTKSVFESSNLSVLVISPQSAKAQNIPIGCISAKLLPLFFCTPFLSHHYCVFTCWGLSLIFP